MSDAVITEAVLRIAVLDIFNNLNIPATGRLTLDHLEREWQNTGLRMDDLVRGTQALIADGDMALQTVEGERCLQLTEKGYETMTATPTPASIRDRMVASRVIHQAQRRMKNEAGPGDSGLVQGEEEGLQRRLRAIPDGG